MAGFIKCSPIPILAGMMWRAVSRSKTALNLLALKVKSNRRLSDEMVNFLSTQVNAKARKSKNLFILFSYSIVAFVYLQCSLF